MCGYWWYASALAKKMVPSSSRLSLMLSRWRINKPLIYSLSICVWHLVLFSKHIWCFPSSSHWDCKFVMVSVHCSFCHEGKIVIKISSNFHNIDDLGGVETKNFSREQKGTPTSWLILYPSSLLIGLWWRFLFKGFGLIIFSGIFQASSTLPLILQKYITLSPPPP